ncbi:chloride channel protein [Niveibacterium terrae]|uniref:chloride channel protein n=1 Tax=Niveibacterium terrae TaxID=3373598 RepID=UPI003A938697
MRFPRIGWPGRAVLDWLRPPRRQRIYARLWLGRLYFWGGAVGVGLLAVLFARLSTLLGSWQMEAATAHRWLPFVCLPLGGAALVALTRRFFPGTEGSGIPQAIAGLKLGADPRVSRLLSLRIIAGKIMLGVSAIGCGFSMGREGPSVQIGASLMQILHQHLPRSLKIPRGHMLIAGAAAGIAAAFNTPLAGVVFAIEEMSRSVEAKLSGLVITAIVLAGVCSRIFLGGGHYFGRVVIFASSRDLVLSVIFAALLCGLTGGLFARLQIMAACRWQGPCARFRSAHPCLFAALCGLLVAGLAAGCDGAVFGSGYVQTRALLEGGAELPWFYGLFKFLATLFSQLSGLPGGIFAPSLAIGAGLGHAVENLSSAAPAMLLVLCMTGYLAAVTQAPITAFVIVMEMVDGYSQIIALMSVALLSSMVSRMLAPPLYHTLARRFVDKALAGPAAGEGNA